MLVITRIGHGEPWLSNAHVAMVLTGLLGMLAFCYWLTRATEPLIPPALLRIPTLRAGLLLMLFCNFLSLGLGVLIPLQAQGSHATLLLIALASGIPPRRLHRRPPERTPETLQAADPDRLQRAALHPRWYRLG
ncbi:MAG: hypothetical protein E2579_05990 [Pseudomonas sp.]|nr:hypothetical protein [Pseudomonas sp.]MPT17306.1 hypothetical protein [Pseudomonas sp.]